MIKDRKTITFEANRTQRTHKQLNFKLNTIGNGEFVILFHIVARGIAVELTHEYLRCLGVCAVCCAYKWAFEMQMKQMNLIENYHYILPQKSQTEMLTIQRQITAVLFASHRENVLQCISAFTICVQKSNISLNSKMKEKKPIHCSNMVMA